MGAVQVRLARRSIGLNVQPFDAGKHRAITLVADAREGLKELAGALADWKAPAAWTANAGKGKAEWRKAAAEVTAATNAALPSDAQVIGAVQRAHGFWRHLASCCGRIAW